MAKLKDSRVYGNLDIDSVLTVASDTTINGNLTVTGNTIYSYVDTMKITDPILELGGGADGAALSSDDGKDRGELLHYYSGGVVDAFMGWDNSAGEFALGSNVSVTNEVVTFNTYGNLRAGTFFGNGSGLTHLAGSNVTGTVGYANMSSYAGIVTASSQPNITSVGTLVNISTSGNISADGNLSVTGTTTLTGDTTVTGNATVGGDLTVTGKIFADVSGNLSAPGSTTQVLFNDNGEVNAVAGFTFNKTSHALSLSGNVSGDTIIGNAFSGDGSGLANIYGPNVSGYVPNADWADNAQNAQNAYNVNGANVSGEVAVANTVSNPTQGNITSVGTLTSLTVSGNISGQANLAISNNATVGGDLDATGNISGADGSFSGTLDVTGNASTGNLSTGIVAATGNVSGANFNTTGTANIGNLKISGQVNGDLIPDANVAYDLGNLSHRWNDLYLSGNTIYLGDQTIEANATALFTSADLAANNITATTNVTAGNVYANSGTVKAAHFVGTIDTASQTNITQVGTLVSLDVTGNAAVGNLLTDNLLYANGQPWDLQQAAGSTGQLQFNDGNDFAASANLTYSDTGAGTLTAAGNIAAAKLSSTGDTTVGADLSVTGNASVTGDITGASIDVSGTATSGNVSTTDVTASGNVTATGNVSADTVVTNDVVASSGDLTLSGQGTNANVVLAPTGTGTISASSKRITNLATPSADTDAVTKGYVDSVAQGLDVKDSVRLATTTALTATYDDNAMTLTGGQSALMLDSMGVENGDRVLVKDQADSNENGIYVVTAKGSVSAAWVLTRATDFNEGSEVPSAFTFIEEGTTQADTGWVCTTNAPVTLGTTNISWSQFSGAGAYSADHGIQLDGTVFKAIVDNSTIDIDGNGALHVKDGLTLVTPNIGAATGTSLDLTGSANVGGDLAVTGNVDANNFNGTFYGSFVGTVDATVGAAGANTQIQFNDAGNIGANAQFTYNKSTDTLSVGNISVGSVSATGDVSADTLTGTLTTASQPNITSVGTLGTLSVTGTATVGNVSTTGTVDAGFLKGDGYQIGNITGANVTGQVANAGWADNATNAQYAYSVNGANVSGDVSGANHANVADVAYSVDGGNVQGQVGNALIAGTVYTNAQPNITSVGTLTSLSVTGNVTTGGILTDNYYYANGAAVDFQTAAGNAGEIQFKSSAGDDLAASANFKFNSSTNVLTVTGNVSVSDSLSAANVTATKLTGTLSTAAQPNVTSVGTLTGLTVDGTTNLGDVGNVVVTGGTSGQYLQTDGLGSLTWSTINTTEITNGTSSVSIPTVDGNVFITVNDTQIIKVTGLGANVTGVLDVTGNVTANNITAANVIVAEGNAAATSAITGTVKVTGGMSATGNIYTGKAVGFANNNGGTDSAAYIQFNASANSLDFIFN